MEKEIFKVGDRVFSIHYGWGVVTNIQNKIMVDFLDEQNDFLLDGKEFQDEVPTLSFTEYTLQGFSQERPITIERPVELPEVGELCLVKDYKTDSWSVREFAEYKHGLFICKAVYSETYVKWKYMKRIKILD